MKSRFITYCLVVTTALAGCKQLSQNNNVDKLMAEAAAKPITDTAYSPPQADSTVAQPPPDNTQPATATISTGQTTPNQLMLFAETQIGVPYKYGSCDPAIGFDCSGFVTYVFNHFSIKVPRSSYGFTHMGKTVPMQQAMRGDILLFTGTDSLANDIGHIGLVMYNNRGAISFIHATSGKQMAVTVSLLDNYYKSRFIRVCRVFPQNG